MNLTSKISLLCEVELSLIMIVVFLKFIQAQSMRNLDLEDVNPIHPPLSTKILPTDFEGTNLSYGFMFEMRSHADIIIYSLDIHTRSELSPSIEVRIKSGRIDTLLDSHSKSSLLSSSWTLVSQGRNISGKATKVGYRTSIPFEDFQPIFLSKNSLHSFYITQDSPQMLSTWNRDGESYQTKTNAKAQSNNNNIPIIDISGGAIVGEFPRGNITRSFTWNGAFIYNILDKSPISSIRPIISHASWFNRSNALHVSNISHSSNLQDESSMLTISTLSKYATFQRELMNNHSHLLSPTITPSIPPSIPSEYSSNIPSFNHHQSNNQHSEISFTQVMLTFDYKSINATISETQKAKINVSIENSLTRFLEKESNPGNIDFRILESSFTPNFDRCMNCHVITSISTISYNESITVAMARSTILSLGSRITTDVPTLHYMEPKLLTGQLDLCMGGSNVSLVLEEDVKLFFRVVEETTKDFLNSKLLRSRPAANVSSVNVKWKPTTTNLDHTFSSMDPSVSALVKGHRHRLHDNETDVLRLNAIIEGEFPAYSNKEFENLIYNTLDAYGSIFLPRLKEQLEESQLSLIIDRIYPLRVDDTVHENTSTYMLNESKWATQRMILIGIVASLALLLMLLLRRSIRQKSRASKKFVSMRTSSTLPFSHRSIETSQKNGESHRVSSLSNRSSYCDNGDQNTKTKFGNWISRSFTKHGKKEAPVMEPLSLISIPETQEGDENECATNSNSILSTSSHNKSDPSKSSQSSQSHPSRNADVEDGNGTLEVSESKDSNSNSKSEKQSKTSHMDSIKSDSIMDNYETSICSTEQDRSKTILESIGENSVSLDDSNSAIELMRSISCREFANINANNNHCNNIHGHANPNPNPNLTLLQRKQRSFQISHSSLHTSTRNLQRGLPDRSYSSETPLSLGESENLLPFLRSIPIQPSSRGLGKSKSLSILPLGHTRREAMRSNLIRHISHNDCDVIDENESMKSNSHPVVPLIFCTQFNSMLSGISAVTEDSREYV